MAIPKETAKDKSDNQKDSPVHPPARGFNKKHALLVAGLLILAGGLVFGGYSLINKNKDKTTKNRVIFTVDGKEYRRAEVLQLTKYPVEKQAISQNDAAKQAMENLQKVRASESLGITPSEEILKQRREQFTGTGKQDDAFEKNYGASIALLAKASAINKYTNGSAPGYKGYVFDFYFGQHIQYGPTYKPEGLNDQNLITQDKKYAESRANFYHDQIKANNLKPDQALKQLLAETKPGNPHGVQLNFSRQFGITPNTPWQSDIYYNSIKQFIALQKQTGLSTMQLGKAVVGSDVKDKDKLVDMYYYFVVLDSVSGTVSVSQQDFGSKLAAIKTDYRGF